MSRSSRKFIYPKRGCAAKNKIRGKFQDIYLENTVVPAKLYLVLIDVN